MEIKDGMTIDIYTQENENLAVRWSEDTGFRISSDTNAVLLILNDAPESTTSNKRKKYFSKLSKQQQIDLILAATNLTAHSSNYGYVGSTLDSILDDILELSN